MGEQNRGFQTDFVTVLDTSKRACTIKDSTVLFLRKRAKWFQKLNLQTLIFGDGEKNLEMQALEVAHCVSKQFVVEIEKQFHSYRVYFTDFSQNILAYQESIIV